HRGVRGGDRGPRRRDQGAQGARPPSARRDRADRAPGVFLRGSWRDPWDRRGDGTHPRVKSSCVDAQDGGGSHVIDERDLFVRAAERFDPPADAYLRFQQREDRHQRYRRVGAVVVGIAVVVALAGGFVAAWRGAQRQKPITTPRPTRVDPSPAPVGGGWASA